MHPERGPSRVLGLVADEEHGGGGGGGGGGASSFSSSTTTTTTGGGGSGGSHQTTTTTTVTTQAPHTGPSMVVVNSGYFRYAQFWQGAGVAMPVFSLRTERSVGCGDFSAIKELADFSEACGIRLIQVRQ